MDINDYISSGIIENYVLNNLSDQERREVECMSHIYPEIKEELELLQSNIELLAEKFAVKAPAHIKGQVLSAIKNTQQEKEVSNEQEEIQSAISNNSSSTWKYLAAACITGMILISSMLFVVNNQNGELNGVIANQDKTIESLKDKELNNQQILAHINDTATQKIVLKGAGKYPNEVATIYWNKDSKETYSLLGNLTPPPANKQFQLWAIVDGKPLDLGVYDVENKLVVNENLIAAQAFAITIEQKGGSPTPNLEELVVIGNI